MACGSVVPLVLKVILCISFLQEAAGYEYPIYDVMALCSRAPTLLFVGAQEPSLILRYKPSKPTKEFADLKRNCSFAVHPTPGHGILTVTRVAKHSETPRLDCTDNIQFNFMSAPDDSETSLKYCLGKTSAIGKMVTMSGELGGDHGTIVLHLGRSGNGDNLPPFVDFTFTQYHDGSCKKGFRCADGSCISPELVCDKHDNCGDLSDESDCDSGLRKVALAAYCLAGVLVATICLGILVWFVRSRSRSKPKTPYEIMKDELLIS